MNGSKWWEGDGKGKYLAEAEAEAEAQSSFEKTSRVGGVVGSERKKGKKK